MTPDHQARPLLAVETRPLSAIAAVSGEALEAGLLAVGSWLASVVITGLIHCASAHHAHPDVLAALDSQRVLGAAEVTR